MPEHSAVSNWARTAVASAETDLSPAVVARVREAVLDHLAVAVGGATLPAAAALAALSPSQAGGSVAIPTRRRLDPVSAATANAAAAHALDLDDGCGAAAGHPGAVVIPAALAAGEQVGCSGARLIQAVALGYELFGRLGAAINPAHLNRGFHTTATVGPLAATIAACIVRGYDEETVRRALSLAGLFGAGFMQVTVDGAEAKPVQVGRAAGAGVQAALLAEQGLEGPRQVIEGESGFFAALVGEPADLAELVLDPSCPTVLDCYVKRHACCRHTHAAIDASIRLRERCSNGAIERGELSVGVYRAALRICGGPPNPSTITDARFSLPFTVALAVVRGNVDALVTGDSTALSDERVLALASRINLVADTDLERRYPHQRGAELTLKLPGGGHERESLVCAHGEPEDPLSQEELAGKYFLLMASAGVSPELADELRTLVDGLDGLSNVDRLVAPIADWKMPAIA